MKIRLSIAPSFAFALFLILSVHSLAMAQAGFTDPQLPSGWETIVPSTLDDQGAGEFGSGSSHGTTYYMNDSGRPGPTVLIVGGVHGNEPAGYLAARRFIHHVPTHGRLIVIPNANQPAIQDRSRMGTHGDLNRDFPRSRGERPDTELAKSIWSTVLDLSPDYLFDFHEGYDFHKVNSKSVGQSIIYYPKGDTGRLAQIMLTAANASVDVSSHRFVLLRYPIKGSLARAAGASTHAKAMIMETSKKQPLETRVQQHMAMMNAALDELGME